MSTSKFNCPAAKSRLQPTRGVVNDSSLISVCKNHEQHSEMTQLKGIFELGPTKAILDFLIDNLKLNSNFSFLAVQDSSIGDLVTHSLTH